jgi:uncharacterized protein (TIGR02444 family)
VVQFPDCAFWDFSLAVYARPDVAPACLGLQERYQADVNLLLYACWLGASGRGALEGSLLARASGLVGGWHRDVVRGLRAVRKRLKSHYDPAPPTMAAPLRRKLAAIELEAEHMEQVALGELAPALPAKPPSEPTRVVDAAKGIVAYLRLLGAGPGDEDQVSLATILAGAFPDWDRDRLTALVIATAREWTKAI